MHKQPVNIHLSDSHGFAMTVNRPPAYHDH